MHTIHCVTAKYSGIKAGSCKEKSLSRVLADGRALFTQTGDFTDPEFMSRLPEGTEVLMGVQAFPDGTLWMHWLHAPGFGTAEQPAPSERAGTGLLTLLSGFAVCALSLSLLVYCANAVMAVLCIFLALAGGMAFFSGAHALTISASGKTRQLRVWLDEAKAGTARPYTRFGSLASYDPDDGGLAEILEDAAGKPQPSGKALYQADERAVDVVATSFSLGTGKHRQDFLRYEFVCAGRRLALTIADDTPSLHAVFQSNHPFMLAEGDRIRAIVGDDGRTVKAMRNFEDGCAYWISGGVGKHKIKKAMKWALLLTPVIPLTGMAAGFFSKGYIDWKLTGLVTLSCLGCVLFVFALAWMVTAGTRNLGSFRADMPFILDALELRPGKGKHKPYIHEL